MAADFESFKGVNWKLNNIHRTFYVRATANDGMENSGWSTTGPFSTGI